MNRETAAGFASCMQQAAPLQSPARTIKSPALGRAPVSSKVAQLTFAAAGPACHCWAAECPGSAADLEQARLASAARKMRLEYLS